jgi:spermidine/putrescine transport system substrate-binding protein
VKGELTISQRPLYIDTGKTGTVAQFEQATGVDVKYIEDINDNAEFFGKMQPLFARGESGGRSLITLSDWLARKASRSAIRSLRRAS